MAIRKLAAILLLAATANGADATSQPFGYDPDGSTVTVTVGSDGACNYANITQAVVLAPAATTLVIHIAKNNVMTATQTIIGRNVEIYGGYDTCSTIVPSGHTLLSGSAFTGSVLRTNASFAVGNAYEVLLSGITIANGTGSSAFPGGGMTIDGPFGVVLVDTYVQGNTTAFSGGGILIRGEPGTGATVLERTYLAITGNSIINDNIAGMGGGIACSGRTYVQTLDGFVTSNMASSAGGGVHSEQCFISIGGHSVPAFGIRNNSVTNAGGTGGGIYAAGGKVFVGGSNTRTSVIANNTASIGGGIAVDTGDLRVQDAHVTSNTATLRGGGIYVVNSTTNVERVRVASICHASLRCLEISDNQVTGTGSTAGGGALFAVGGTTRIAGAFIENNRVAAGRGMAVAASNALGTGGGAGVDGLRILGSVIATNGTGGPAVGTDSSVVHIENSSAALGFNTFSRNLAVPRIVYTPTTGGGPLYPIRIYGTIFDSPTGLAASPGTTGTVPTGDCNRLNESSSPFATGSARSTSLAPMFVNAAANDFMLAFNSPMLDWCDASFNYSIGLTGEGGVRPYDDPFFTPVYGNWDLGALELQPLDILFKNGFE